MASRYPVRFLPKNAPEAIEAVGSREKFWIREKVPGTQQPRRGIFKYSREGSREHCSECIVAEIAELLNIPHAACELAVHLNRRGNISWSFLYEPKLDNEYPINGNNLLRVEDPKYPQDLGTRITHQHTLTAVLKTLHRMDPPLRWRQIPDGITNGADTFVGYLMLDALVGNTDRHDENWAIVRSPLLKKRKKKHESISPTFDHASSLGRELSDDAIQSKGPRERRAYAERARTPIYEDGSKLATLDAFAAAKAAYPRAARVWMNILSSVALESLHLTIREMPEDWMSALARGFACDMISINRERILALG